MSFLGHGARKVERQHIFWGRALTLLLSYQLGVSVSRCYCARESVPHCLLDQRPFPGVVEISEGCLLN